MARLSMSEAHRLGREEALRRLKERLSLVRDAHGHHVSDLHEEWNDDVLSFGFKAMGLHVAGTLAVKDREVRLAADVPFAVVMLRGRIERRIRAELDELLS